jgi:hypothetical protein
MYDVVIISEPSDFRVATTCRTAFEREGWRVGDKGVAKAYVVIWSEITSASLRLKSEALEPLLNDRLLQIFVQPVESGIGWKNVIEPPEPFCYFQSLPVLQKAFNGSERVIDLFWHRISEGNRVLAEVARLGSLSRPRDSWNARVVFSKIGAARFKPVIVAEYTASGHLLRRDYIASFTETSYDTTIGNTWVVIEEKSLKDLGKIKIRRPATRITFPGNPPWWQNFWQKDKPRLPLRVRSGRNKQEVAVDEEVNLEQPTVADVKSDVFISYSRTDKDYASFLHILCEYEGWKVWWDPKIKLGADFRPLIDKAIRSTGCVIVIWSDNSESSPWVNHEVRQALDYSKLVEIDLRPHSAQNAIRMSTYIHIDKNREELLAKIAAVGRLKRPCDQWNATLSVTNDGNEPPTEPIIALEWIPVDGMGDSTWVREINDKPYRLARRERWINSPTINFGTAQGNFWLFGHEGEKFGLGCFFAKKGENSVTLSARNRRYERIARREAITTVPFKFAGGRGEMMDFDYPDAPSLDSQLQI